MEPDIVVVNSHHHPTIPFSVSLVRNRELPGARWLRLTYQDASFDLPRGIVLWVIEKVLNLEDMARRVERESDR